MTPDRKQAQALQRLEALDPGNTVFWDQQTHAPKFAKGVLSAPSGAAPEDIARTFLATNADLRAVADNLEEGLEVSHMESDNQGFRHVFFQQRVGEVPVFEGSTQVHIDPQGRVVAYKDHRLTRVEVDLEPRVTEQQALATALRELGAGSEGIEYDAHLSLFRDTDQHQYLAWEVELRNPREFSANRYFVDAHDNRLLYKFCETREALSRTTYDAANGESLPGALAIRDAQTSDDAVIQAAHDNASEVYDYYRDTFGRDSYDGRGAPLVSSVHFRRDYNNAFWLDAYKQMVYGDGDGARFRPLAFALDVVGHELTHAVTSSTARFVYAEESGALDESFADVFGVMISNDGEIVDWQMGEGVYTPFQDGDALRDLADPTRFGQPDHMNEIRRLAPGELPDPNKNDNGYVHGNSGIPNKAAYLIVAGGTHHGLRIDGVGRAKGEQIYYSALTQYLSSATRSRWTFKQARYALLNACRQLYGDQGAEYATVKNAWAAVGVGEPATTNGRLTGAATPGAAIPDQDQTGVTSVISLGEPGRIKEASIRVAIRHSYIGDLRVVLHAPSGPRVVLHDRSGGSAHDIAKTYSPANTPALQALVGEDSLGDWTLTVSDHARFDTGVLERWSLSLDTEPALPRQVRYTSTPDLAIPDNDPQGVMSVIPVGAQGQVLNLTVEVDIEHSYIGDLRVRLVTPEGSEWVLHDRAGNSRRDLRRGYATGSDPALRELVGTALHGDWTLKVSDHADVDTGTLKAWSLTISYR